MNTSHSSHSSHSDRQVALITGGSRGIGAAVARRLAASGMYVFVNYRSRAEAAKLVVEEILEAGGHGEVVQADVVELSQVRAMFQQIRRSCGRLDVLVNSAGIAADGFSLMMSDQKWLKVIETDLNGAFRCCREGIMLMLAGGGGSVVNIASVSGLVGTPGQANYSAAKAGLIALTKTLSHEFATRGVRVNAVVPGLIETDLLKAMPKEALAEWLRQVPMGRIGTCDEAATAVCWLASEEASYVTGTTLVVDGGLTRRG
jgi:3-oxoacyl-[acyl-carrier protein] reductase